ncbi:MAG TPA: helix-turn-helix transcriptional regulator [Ktedonobacteraceae bacterium]
MPRPSKRVAPDTLGGRLRSARQNLHLSLADVAGNRYSTSLISQIERNRVDPSTESLHYLAERLQLPYEDLQILARQHRESETEATLYREYEAKHAEINQLLVRRQPAQALTHFNDKAFKLDQLPLFLRWRTLALRGQAFFEQREFSKAQRDFQSSLTIMPASVSDEHQLEVIKLRLHMAEATRELNQFEQALEYYREALHTMDASTALRYIAEAHWGIALVYYNQGRAELLQDSNKTDGQNLLQEAWQHAEDARTLYNSIADHLNADLLQCQMAQIEQAQNKITRGKQRLLTVLTTWQPGLQNETSDHHPRKADRANVVSAAACYLASIECQAHDFENALKYIEIAINAGLNSYKVRQAEAFMMKGQILEVLHAQQTSDSHDPAITESYKKAIDSLKDTGRKGIMSQAHYEFGRYLLSVGQREQGDQEMEIARGLAGIPSNFHAMQQSADERSADNV